MGKKIAIVGAHGTGKTTMVYDLATSLKRQHLHVGITSEGARSSPYLIAGEHVPELEMDLFGRQIVSETEALRSYELVVCDKSVFETVMYSRLLFPNLHNHSFNAIEQFAKPYAATYNVIFRTTILHDLSKTRDPLRPTDPTLQTRAHRMLKDVLNEFEVRYYDLPKKNSIDFMIQTLKNKEIIPAISQ